MDLILYLGLLHTPALPPVTLGAAVVCGTLGWRRVSGRARAAWNRAVVCAGTIGPGAYRAVPQETRILGMPLLVPALGFTSHALHVGHAGAIVVFAVAAWSMTCGTLAAAALYLATLGVVTSRGALALVTRSSPDMSAVRRRASLCASLSIHAHGMIVLGLAALKMGWLDMLYCVAHYHGIKGAWRDWEGMTVRAFLEVEPSLSSGPLVGGYSPDSWNKLGAALLIYACVSLIEAALVLAVAHQSRWTRPAPCSGRLARRAHRSAAGGLHPGAHRVAGQPADDVSSRSVTASPVAAGEPPLPPPLRPPPDAAAHTRSRP